MTTVTCSWKVGASLGEGPIWDPRRRCLWFVDILGGTVHRFDPATRTGATFQVGGLPSFIVLAPGDDLLLGNRHELQLFDGERITKTIARLALPDGVRLNDATVDPSGRLWFGTMDMAEQEPLGCLFCMTEGVVRDTGIRAVVTNGPALTADGETLYHADTVTRRIMRYTVAADGSLRDEILFGTIEEGAGYPDGLVIDTHGQLWVGLWQGSAVRRYAPGGQMIEELRFPAGNITKVAFGGDALLRAYVTSASIEDQTTARESGALFEFSVAVPGSAACTVRLER